MICEGCKSVLDLKLIEKHNCVVCSVSIFDQVYKLHKERAASIKGRIRQEISGNKNQIDLIVETLNNFDFDGKRSDRILSMTTCAKKLINIFEANYKSKYIDDFSRSNSGRLSRAVKSNILLENLTPNEEVIDIIKDYIVSAMCIDILRIDKYGK